MEQGKLSTGSLILLALIFFIVVVGFFVIRLSYNKPVSTNKIVLETTQTLEYGDISYERFYKNGNNIKAFGFYKNGAKKSEYYVMDNEGLSSKFISYFPDGTLESKMDRWIEGDAKQYFAEEYYPNGKLRRREGTKLTKWEYYDETGNPTLLYEHQGDRTIETLFYPNGKRQEKAEFLYGKRDGVWMQWDTLGILTKNEIYKAGVRAH